MVQIQDTIVSLDVITKEFCCDLKKCHGACCIEGDAGAPVTPEEIAQIEELLPVIKDMLSADALKAIEERGRKANTGDRPVVMLDAHSDEVGFMVRAINPNGTLAFIELGGIRRENHQGQRVKVRTTSGKYIPGLQSRRLTVRERSVL